MSSSSSGGGRPGGRFVVDPMEGKKTRCYAGDDNQLLKLDEGALKMLDSKLTDLERWQLSWAMERAERIKNGRGSKWSKAFMVEAVDGSVSL